jgi:uracil phosphoribosyltransferase
MNANRVNVLHHPLIQQKLTRARDRRTDRRDFRDLLSEIAGLMVFELTRDYAAVPVEIDTPLAPFTGSMLAADVTVVPILRAGLGMADGILKLIPQARVGHLGVYRDEETLAPVAYYDKLPGDLAGSDVIVIDPMLATGGSCSHALSIVKRHGARRIKVVCLVAAPRGIERLGVDHPDVPIYTAAIDERLNEHGYIVPGLGDAGDRMFGTK